MTPRNTTKEFVMSKLMLGLGLVFGLVACGGVEGDEGAADEALSIGGFGATSSPCNKSALLQCTLGCDFRSPEWHQTCINNCSTKHCPGGASYSAYAY